VGVVSAPALGRRWWAERSVGAFADGEPIRVSSVDRVEDAVLSPALDCALHRIKGQAPTRVAQTSLAECRRAFPPGSAGTLGSDREQC
jgi:fructose-1,6-bisphosphatase/inositol monophosphatase family enzyme